MRLTPAFICLMDSLLCPIQSPVWRSLALAMRHMKLDVRHMSLRVRHAEIMDGLARLDARQLAWRGEVTVVVERRSQRGIRRTNDIGLALVARQRHCSDDGGLHPQGEALIDGVTEDEGLGLAGVDLGPERPGPSGSEGCLHPGGIARQDDHSPFIEQRERVELA